MRLGLSGALFLLLQFLSVSEVTAGGESTSAPELRHRTLPAAISRRAVTISRLSVSRSGFAPLKSCFALFEARITSSNRLGIFPRQSSTVMRAMNIAPTKFMKTPPFALNISRSQIPVPLSWAPSGHGVCPPLVPIPTKQTSPANQCLLLKAHDPQS